MKVFVSVKVRMCEQAYVCGWLYTSVSECVYGVRDLENLDPEFIDFK